MKQIFTLALLAGVVSFSACKKDAAQQEVGTTTPTTKIAPDGFNFSTSKNINLNLTLKANNNGALSGVIVSVYLPTNTSEPIYKGVTNKSGQLQGIVTVPTSVSKLIIDPAYVGLMRNAEAAISSSNSVTATIGGKEGFSGDIVAQEITNTATSTTLSTNRTTLAINPPLAYPSPYTSSSQAIVNTSTYPFKLGRPVYLESTQDVIDPSLLSYINASLPEGSALTKTHPEYLSNTAMPDLNVTATSDVWITFVSEGAGLLNSLGYYTYPTNNPPASAADISKITLIFPNSSAVGSAGGLNSGDKVKLGRFSAGTSIGFVLLQNAWSTTSGVITTTVKFYSNPKFNPETTAATQKHTVTLYDDVHKLFLMGFEDLNRQTESDNDFNDLVVYASSNPVTAISTDNVPSIDKGGDSDGDGVQDAQDAFPNDPTRAYVSYYPSKTGYASIAFEDNWPKKGDFDLNDLVVNYRYTFTSNASNQVVDMKGEFTPVASGASFHNGFAVQLPVAASAVSSVTGQQTISNYISFAGNGVEAGQTKAVIVPFDNHEALLKNPDGAFFINVYADKNKVTGSTATVNVTFASPIAASNLQVSAFNPFLISDMRRGYEIHLPGFAPTDKADSKLFGTDDDASNAASGKLYVSKENWPWAINFTSEYKYPVELQPVYQAYPRFSEWALSGGTSYADWYSNTGAGYRDLSKIYTK
ncbi:LruC domain-containing protein [Mucilaginibacter sp. Bleaf8]|uniref:LruC domain-containing protein n=1 Tax=Mucilaginibacter sp. Bleaf8 TaxID=2834430 RepID=UPI001BCD44B7|nr:LruC domain-containing protein [Mucilaginibacter sp. Bleaf8]MBS7566997.1 LruC domain-containing protein [Mucilaginibacter sp. Bleaf8]